MRKSLSLAVSLASLEAGHPFLATPEGAAAWAAMEAAGKSERSAWEAANNAASYNRGAASTAHSHAMGRTQNAADALRSWLERWLHTPRDAWRVELTPGCRMGFRDDSGKWVEHFWNSREEADATLKERGQHCPGAKVVYGRALTTEPR